MNVKTARNYIIGTDMSLLNYCFQRLQTVRTAENRINIRNHSITKKWSA